MKYLHCVTIEDGCNIHCHTFEGVWHQRLVLWMVNLLSVEYDCDSFTTFVLQAMSASDSYQQVMSHCLMGMSNILLFCISSWMIFIKK